MDQQFYFPHGDLRVAVFFVSAKGLLLAESVSTDCWMGTSEVVKGCKMPAPSRRPVSLDVNSTGRRLTSLKGGNRGRQPRG